MVAHIQTIAFSGVDALPVEVQVHLAPGQNAFTIVGLPDKSVAESRERVRAALAAIGLALPYERITINLSPADMPKEGSHYDLPIALGLIVAMGGLAQANIDGFLVMGELGLDGSCIGVPGALPAAMAALERQMGLVCPAACGAEAAWSGLCRPDQAGIVAAPHILQAVNHLRGTQILPSPQNRAARSGARLSRHGRCARPASIAFGVGSCRGWGPQLFDERPARCRKVYAGGAFTRSASRPDSQGTLGSQRD